MLGAPPTVQSSQGACRVTKCHGATDRVAGARALEMLNANVQRSAFSPETVRVLTAAFFAAARSHAPQRYLFLTYGCSVICARMFVFMSSRRSSIARLCVVLLSYCNIAHIGLKIPHLRRFIAPAVAPVCHSP
jgi:hypothetical protein